MIHALAEAAGSNGDTYMSWDALQAHSLKLLHGTGLLPPPTLSLPLLSSHIPQPHCCTLDFALLCLLHITHYCSHTLMSRSNTVVGDSDCCTFAPLAASDAVWYAGRAWTGCAAQEVAEDMFNKGTLIVENDHAAPRSACPPKPEWSRPLRCYSTIMFNAEVFA